MAAVRQPVESPQTPRTPDGGDPSDLRIFPELWVIATVPKPDADLGYVKSSKIESRSSSNDGHADVSMFFFFLCVGFRFNGVAMIA